MNREVLLEWGTAGYRVLKYYTPALVLALTALVFEQFGGHPRWMIYTYLGLAFYALVGGWLQMDLDRITARKEGRGAQSGEG